MKKLMTSVLSGVKAVAMSFAAASIASGSFPANAQSSVRDIANMISGTVDAFREGREQSAASVRVKEIFALANEAARADDNVNFCGFFMGMSRQDANALAEHYGLKDGEYRFESESEKAVWRIHFSLKGVRRVTKGGNTFAELAQAVANRVGNMEGRGNLLTDERWYERKTIDGIVVRMHDSEGLTIQQESARRKMPMETASVRAERRRVQETEEAERRRAAEAERQKAEREALRKAAEQGDARAQTELGLCYYEGNGVAQNKEEAVRWYRKAAEQGFAAAQDALDKCYYADGKIPDGARRVKDRAFEGRCGLTSITIPSSVTSIGDSAFSGCDGLTSVTIPDSVTSIGVSAFYRCKGLMSITIPSSVTSIGDSAFSDCDGLTSVTIPDGVTSIGDYAFSHCRGLTNVTIGDSVTRIGNGAFSECRHLTSVTIPNGVTKIGREAFCGCSGLASVTIPDGVTEIGDYAFGGCSGLTSVTIPGGVTSIGDSAFFECSGLTSVTIPNNVTSIGAGAFWHCWGLTSITIGNGVTSIGKDAFERCSALKVAYLPKSLKGKIGRWLSSPFPWYTKIVYDGDDGGSGVFLLLVVAIVVGVTLVVLKRRGRLDRLFRSKAYIFAQNVCRRTWARVRAAAARR